MTGHRNGGAAVVKTLAAHGVDTIFGIPGTHNLELYRHFPATVAAIMPKSDPDFAQVGWFSSGWGWQGWG